MRKKNKETDRKINVYCKNSSNFNCKYTVQNAYQALLSYVGEIRDSLDSEMRINIMNLLQINREIFNQKEIKVIETTMPNSAKILEKINNDCRLNRCNVLNEIYNYRQKTHFGIGIRLGGQNDNWAIVDRFL